MNATPQQLKRPIQELAWACAPSQMPLPNRPWFWIETPTKRKVSTPLALAFDARSVAGRPARMTVGSAPAAMNGTRLIREECAPPASTSGLRLSAFLVAAGRRTQNGMCSNAFTNGNKPRTAAKGETTGYERACRRAFDWQPRSRLGSAVGYRALRRCAQGTRFR
jgi:hypothetical protein